MDGLKLLQMGVAFCLPLVGCADGGGDALATVVTDTIDGVERWVYPGAGGPSLNWTADTTAVIGGSMETADTYQFGQVHAEGLAADEAGRLYVLDRAGKRVLVYDSIGRYVTTYGRAGGGPGELAVPVGLAVGASDSIWVADIGNRRYTIYPRDGGDARSFPFDESLGFPGTALAVRGDAFIQDFRLLHLLGASRRSSAGTAPADPPRPILRLNRDGVPLDTLWLSDPPRTAEARSGGNGRTIAIRMRQMFSPELRWAALSNGSIVVSDGAGYVLHIVRPDGTVVRRIERDLPARATTEADRERAREALRERVGSGMGIRITTRGGGGAGPPPPSVDEMLEAQLEAMSFAPVIPRITGLRVDPHDRIWVGVSLDEAGTTGRIDIYDQHGSLLGELTELPLPDAFLGPSLAANLTHDELGVQQIVIYRIAEHVQAQAR